MPWWLLVGLKIEECYKYEGAEYNSCWATHRQCSLASYSIAPLSVVLVLACALPHLSRLNGHLSRDQWWTTWTVFPGISAYECQTGYTTTGLVSAAPTSEALAWSLVSLHPLLFCRPV